MFCLGRRLKVRFTFIVLRSGKLILFGAEGGGGKIRLLNAGAYADHDVDISMMAHPGIGPDAALVRTAAYAGMKVEYFGKEAHAAARPWEGVRIFPVSFSRLPVMTDTPLPDQRPRRPHHSLQRSLRPSPANTTRRYHPKPNYQRRSQTQHHTRIQLRAIRRPFGNKSPS